MRVDPSQQFLPSEPGFFPGLSVRGAIRLLSDEQVPVGTYIVRARTNHGLANYHDQRFIPLSLSRRSSVSQVVSTHIVFDRLEKGTFVLLFFVVVGFWLYSIADGSSIK